MDIIKKIKCNYLVHLALADGGISNRERETIFEILGLEPFDSDCNQLISQPKPRVSLGALSGQQQVDFLYSLVRLMNCDDELNHRELLFIQDLAVKLGFRKKVVDELWILMMEQESPQPEVIWEKAKDFHPFW